MDWLDRLNSAVSYLEENLTGVIDYRHAAQTPVVRNFIFNVYSPTSPIPLSEYVW